MSYHSPYQPPIPNYAAPPPPPPQNQRPPGAGRAAVVMFIVAGFLILMGTCQGIPAFIKPSADMMNQLRQMNPNVQWPDRRQALVSLMVMIALGATFLALAFAVLKGRRWAMTTGMVIGGLLFAYSALSAVAVAVYLNLGGLQLLFGAFITVAPMVILGLMVTWLYTARRDNRP